jgi:hypothetical protein
MYPNQQVVTSYCVGRVMSYDPTTQIVRVLHRLSEHSWVVKTHHKDDVMEYRGMMWSMKDAF